LFISDTERSRFLNHLVKGTREILRTQQGLALHANYHEFCRLLGRLKTNYQLAELVRRPSLPSRRQFQKGFGSTGTAAPA
jgi:hypothetical protein